MPRHAIKKSKARSEYGSWKAWFREQLNLPDEVALSARDAGMYSNVNVTITFPDGEEFEFGGYFSGGISPHYVITTTPRMEEKIKEKAGNI